MSGKGFSRRTKWKWTPEIEDRLAGLYGMYKPCQIASIISKETGHTFTSRAITYHATTVLGINTVSAQGRITISDAARDLGVNVQTLHALITKRKLLVERTRSGYCRYLTVKTWAFLQAYYAEPPEPTITLQETAERLKRGLDWTYNQVRAGKLKAWKQGGKWRVSSQDTERLRWDLAKISYQAQQRLSST